LPKPISSAAGFWLEEHHKVAYVEVVLEKGMVPRAFTGLVNGSTHLAQRATFWDHGAPASQKQALEYGFLMQMLKVVWDDLQTGRAATC